MADTGIKGVDSGRKVVGNKARGGTAVGLRDHMCMVERSRVGGCT